MPIPKEICVFFPCHTLEDFPTHLRDDAAEGLLAAWTSPWHPRILAATGALPAWYRADTPPLEIDGRLLLVASAAESRIPRDLEQRVGDARDAHLLNVADRDGTAQAILQYLDQTSPNQDSTEDAPTTAVAPATAVSPATHAPAEMHGTPGVLDFYALGYVALQVQVMTRQLRYSSNLDQVVFAEHAVAAARAWCAGNMSQTQERLQAAFDLLAEERDHYFSADPHLIDLVLVAESTLGAELLETLAEPTPINLLMSAAVAEQLASQSPEALAQIQRRHADGTLGVATGGPDDQTRLELLDSTATAHWIEQALRRTEAALGFRPTVFGRVGGGIPGDLPPVLVAAGYQGAITYDFTSGTGSQSEAKMMWQAGGAEIEALTARPLDVLQPQTFLALGPKLGEAADSGQVSAALMVRWPGTDSPLLSALRRASSYGVALGRFWTVDDVFTKGERPYHSCTLPSAVADGAALSQAVERGEENPLSGPAKRFDADLRKRAAAACESLATLSTPEPLVGSESDAATRSASECADSSGACLGTAARRLARAMGFTPADSTPESGSTARPAEATPPAAALVLHPHCGAARAQVLVAGPAPPPKTPGLFGVTQRRGLCDVSLDVPGVGFAALASGTSGGSGRSGMLSWLKRPKSLASGLNLRNEFLDAAIHPDTGALAAVHSGAMRGNRFSWQLAYYDSSGPDDGYSTMRCTRSRVLHADTARGTIETEGQLIVQNQSVGQFRVHYTVRRGSRWLELDVDVDMATRYRPEPWRNYLAGRAAWSIDALSVRPLVRDKRHRSTGRRIEAPLGVVVDEGDRTLQVCGFGLPAHRRIGSKRLDTLLQVAGEQEHSFRLAYGFDVPAPVRSAHHLMVPPIVVPTEKMDGPPRRGWLVDVDSRAAAITGWSAPDGQTLELRIVETTGKPVRASVRVFRDVLSAARVPSGTDVPVEDGAALVRLAGHEVTVVRLKLAPLGA